MFHWLKYAWVDAFSFSICCLCLTIEFLFFLQFGWVVMEKSNWVACRSCNSRWGHWIWGPLPHGFSKRRSWFISYFHTRIHQGRVLIDLRVNENSSNTCIHTYIFMHTDFFADDTRYGNRTSSIHQLQIGGFQQLIPQNLNCSTTSSFEYSRDRSRKKPQTLPQANQPLSYGCFKYVFFSQSPESWHEFSHKQTNL